MIYVFLAEGFEEIEAITPIDMLRRSGKDVVTVGVTGKTALGSHGIPVVCDKVIDDVSCDDAEMIILPGGKLGTQNLGECKKLADIISSCNEKGIFIGAICAAPSVIGQMGLLNGRKAVCYPGWEDKLTGALIQDVPSVRDGHFITARGAGASLEFSYELISALFDKETADKLAGSIVWAK